MSTRLDVKNCLKANAELIAAKKKEIATLEERMNNMDDLKKAGESIDMKAYQAYSLKRSHLKGEIASIKDKALKAAEELYDKAIEGLRIDDFPKASEISEDAKLLRSGIVLRSDELTALMRKEENQNVTMYRMFEDYASQHEIEIPQENKLIGRGKHADEIEALTDEKHAIPYAVRWLEDPSAETMIDRMLGEGDVYQL